jgi:CBS domain-containing protein
MTTVRIDTIMQTGGPELTPDTPIRRASAILVEARADAAPVLDQSGRLVGLVTQKDCFRPALHASYYQEWNGTVADHMTRTVKTLPVTADLSTAATAFIEHPHRVFPVLSEDRLVGMLQRSDVLAALVRMG